MTTKQIEQDILKSLKEGDLTEAIRQRKELEKKAEIESLIDRIDELGGITPDYILKQIHNRYGWTDYQEKELRNAARLSRR